MSSKSIYRFYVYAYIRSKDSTTAKAGTPYYIGKGTGTRAFKKHGNVVLPTSTNSIILLETRLSEVGALALERRLIEWWGRKDNDTGILLNRTDGGDGVSGGRWKQSKPRSEEHRKKISENKTGKRKFYREDGSAYMS